MLRFSNYPFFGEYKSGAPNYTECSHNAGSFLLTTTESDGFKGFMEATLQNLAGEVYAGRKIPTRGVILAVAGTASVLATSMLIFCLLRRKARRASTALNPESAKIELLTPESLQYDLVTIQLATENFSDKNKIGKGGFGIVYKGMLENGQEIAVKRLTTNSEHNTEELKNEVVLVAKLQHRNLVRLMGFCLAGEEKLLVFEFVPNKSLDYFLFDQAKKEQLDWKRRYKIIEGVARGLLYLHEDSRHRIIHRDLKAGNILLDADMMPKISDFGTARLVGMDASLNETQQVAGTLFHESDQSKKEQLDWKRRYKIIEGVARGLLYLHEDSRHRIIHRDLKAGNILLDADMMPKITDFGTARLVGMDASLNETQRVAGTLGYMAPEYILQGQFSVKSDVYSFGVLTLEIISGKRVRSFDQSGKAQDLLNDAWNCWNSGGEFEFMDDTLRNSQYSSTSNEVRNCIHLGLLCVQADIDKRPIMASVVNRLNSLSLNTLPVPQQPAYISNITTESSSGSVTKGTESQSSMDSGPRY
ncbi:Cysteine-rich receptor-like protein [Drosera capensis]